MVPLPQFASVKDVLPYLCRNYHQLTMEQFTSICEWGLDPGFVQRDMIAKFIEGLTTVEKNKLPQNQECQICFRPHSTHSSDGKPAVRLSCNHIVEADCLCEWLKTQDYCPHCRIKVFERPTDRSEQILNPRQAQVLVGMLESGKKFKDENSSGPHANSCWGFRNWASEYTEDKESFVARNHARAHIARWDAYNSPTSKGL